MKKTVLSVLLGAGLLLTGCGGEEAPTGKTPKDALELDSNSMKEKLGEEMFERTRDIFYSMPSPLELQSIVEQAGGYFRADLLHNPKLSSQYQSTEKQAMVMGVYGTDMSYATLYKQQQESILHLAAAQRVAKGMGVTDPFQGHLIDRANANIANKDSMMLIVSEMYWEMNSQLQEEDRNALGLVVLACGWVEGVYIGTQILDIENPNKNVAEVLIEQRYIASQINDMLEDYQDAPMVAEVRSKLQGLIDIFLGLEVIREPAQLRQENGKTVIGGNQRVNWTIEDLNNIRSAAAELRQNLIAL